LQEQLRAVYAATLESVDDGSGRGHSSRGFRGRRGRGGRVGMMKQRRGPWTQEQGDEDGLEVLKRLCESQEGMREFVDLIGLRYGAKEGEVE
jgi:hypothetical protein